MPVLAEELTRFKAHRWQISCLEFNHDGSQLASGGWDKEVHIWDLGSLEIAHTLKGSRVPITCLSWYRQNSGILCTGSADQTASLWNTETGSRIAMLKEHFGWVLGSCFSTSGSLLATASWDKTVRIWDAGTATLINNLSGHTAGVWSVDFHPKSSTLCSAGQDGSVIVWDARSNKPVCKLSSGHTDAVYSAKWSPDGAIIASGSADTKICIWEPSKGSVINTIYGHTDTVKSIAFNPNSGNVALPILASAGDYSLRLSDPRPTQKADILSCSLHTPGKEVEAVSISPDGSLLVTGGRDGLLILMNLYIPSLIPRTETRLTTSAAVRHSRDQDQTRMYGDSDPAAEIPSGSRAGGTDENLRTMQHEANELVDIHKGQKRQSRLAEKKPHLATKVTHRRARELRAKRIKEKVVDIPTMIAHLSARASFMEDPNGSDSGSSSSSSSSSSTELDEDSESEDLESQFLVNVSERANRFMKRKNTVQEIMESSERPPPAQRLSLLPDDAVGRLKERRNIFEKGGIEQEEEEETPLFDENAMENVVLLMQSYHDDSTQNVATGQRSDTERDYFLQVEGLIPGEEGDTWGQPWDHSINSTDSTSADDESLHHDKSGQYSFLPEHPNTSLNFSPEQFQPSHALHSLESRSHDQGPGPALDGRQKAYVADAVLSVEDSDTAGSLPDRISSASGNEYGDEVPLSMI